jgi:murein DD-endopeptidase MepM/ murein hydrolase activator NlpD
MSQFGTRARALFDRVFPERQIYHRSGGSVRYVSLSPSKQALLALGAVGVAGWCSYASVTVMMGGQVLSAQGAEMDRLEQKYKRLLADSYADAAAMRNQLEERTHAFETATSEFQRRHETLKTLLDLAGSSSISGSARPIESDGADLLVQAKVEEAEPRQSRDWEQPGYQVQTVGFRAKVEQLKLEQASFLAAAEEAAVERSEQARGILSMTGVGLSRLVDSDATGAGGPLIPIDVTGILGEGGLDKKFANRIKQVAARVSEARRLDAILVSTPLRPPVGVDYRETSGYGVRYDPFTRRLAVHGGLDLVAYDRAPVIATSPGVVRFAGARPAYGLVVEIDHGHGFWTRYGHLRELQVSRGEKVAIGQRVGSMGSTGRSTGTHLHYEVWFRDKTYDPVDFLRAGQHVHEQG